ncbi:MAG TPA: gamma-glutamyl-gamma-aminobutyrate hydrolase family protein [Clostridia bacterium]|nr:gamma-glutamyl-gamma-aminobutyrate hydrolase family protein [Clostridia bacterium]
MKPIIGVTSRFLEKDNNFVTRANYVNAVADSGGIPILLPVNAPDVSEELMKLVDGFIIPGGADVAPLFYGEQPYLKVSRTCRRNDEFEVALIHDAIRQKKPILGICRGIQVINVSFGGTLYQDIPTQAKSEICHYQDAAAKGEMTHSVTLEEDSYLFSILKQSKIDVNSYHHQAVREAAPGLRAVAFAPDGVIEAIENADGSVLGVQWHPEGLHTICDVHARLLKSFVERCRNR